MSQLFDVSTEPAGLQTMARRRRITHIVAAALLVVVIVALILDAGHDDETTALTMIGGVSLILLMVSAVVSVQYSVRMRMRRSHGAPDPLVDIPPTSLAFQPVQQMRLSQVLLDSVLPRIEKVSAGMTTTAQQASVSLEDIARQVVMQERIVATLTAGDSDPRRLAEMKRSLQVMSDRLRSGVDTYTEFAQKASVVSVSLGDLDDSSAITAATDQLTGLAQGLQEVQQISGRQDASG